MNLIDIAPLERWVELEKDIHRKSGLAHCGTARDDDQVGRLQARCKPVKIQEARRDTGDITFKGIEFLDFCHRLAK